MLEKYFVNLVCSSNKAPQKIIEILTFQFNIEKVLRPIVGMFLSNH